MRFREIKLSIQDTELGQNSNPVTQPHSVSKGLSLRRCFTEIEHLPNTGPAASKNLKARATPAILRMIPFCQVPLLSLSVEKRYIQVSKRVITPAKSKSSKNMQGWSRNRKFIMEREVLCSEKLPIRSGQENCWTHNWFIWKDFWVSSERASTST